MDLSIFRDRMSGFPSYDHPSDRQLAVLSWLTKLSRDSGCADPVLVGCGAVELYTNASSSTGDHDIVTPDKEKLTHVLLDLGFQRSSNQRFVYHPGHSILFEFPATKLYSYVRTIKIEHDGIDCTVMSPEDVILDRLESFEASGGGTDLVYAYILFKSFWDYLDYERLRTCVKRRDIRESFRFIRSLREDAEKMHLSIMDQSAELSEECRRRRGA
ncbi:MAG: hypothetical protein NTY09_10115 [bacterium]|nr:hypothetical protein [bacterium]